MAFFPGVSMPAYFQSIATARTSGQQVFHDFLEPALLSGWPVFQLIHFFTSIVTRSSGQAVHSLQVLSYSSRVTNAKCVNQDKTKSLRSLSYRNVRTEAL